ncbi:SDR family oxidoreductase [Limnoglobus roseus]|uniref:KR domain-containing protein n=1 Tax=Limnoglobus roseus TaxID=2598579 RepID=A0A5C1AAB4_9BACT|nr:SDR family NAD(P)-dependent oxidoreductase [Limnoglobus roseus]QEL15113.1 KR domain-containing protein [Limnoglobus roseus]
MDMKGNTILITGGGSGIGRGLAEAFHKLGNQVIISGRRKDVLDQVTAANPGMKSLPFDIEDATGVKTFAEKVIADFPKLNAVVHNAGIARMENLKEQKDVSDAEAMVATNVLGPIRLNSALLPHLLKQPKATVITVSSGLAFVPLAAGPTYSATKAFLHSYTQSLRHQLQGTKVQVIELPPPYVQTELAGPQQATDPRAVPLAVFIAGVMDILTKKPDATEAVVKECEAFRNAINGEGFDKAFTAVNSMFDAH